MIGEEEEEEEGRGRVCVHSCSLGMPAHERSENDPTTAHTDSTGESITVLTYTLPLTANLVFCSLLLLLAIVL
jgi:hypothetical protein